MSEAELAQLVADRIKFLSDHNINLDCERCLCLTMPIPKSWRNKWFRPKVKTPFGLVRCYPSGDSTKLLVYPTIQQLLKYLEKVRQDD